jgi:hypothetical protein
VGRIFRFSSLCVWEGGLKLSFGIATGEKGCSLSDVLKKAEDVLG